MVAFPSGSTFTSTDITGTARNSRDVGLETSAFPSGSTFNLPKSDPSGNARQPNDAGLGTSDSGSTLTLPDLTGNAGKSSAVGTRTSFGLGPGWSTLPRGLPLSEAPGVLRCFSGPVNTLLMNESLRIW
ncbi:hypothetical protein DPMN_104325 [Dreissena polymorpha]|uniref:Uncharacterized protein n=1 Tax=Dreissena polymorpha TaxID=45954 RepID=A0A9D4K1J6_DREPO|nr:hypothetical protein DPMN_104325 [Dreissena polymorpha]